jgi:hypothetical protein
LISLADVVVVCDRNANDEKDRHHEDRGVDESHRPWLLGLFDLTGRYLDGWSLALKDLFGGDSRLRRLAFRRVLGGQGRTGDNHDKYGDQDQQDKSVCALHRRQTRAIMGSSKR